ncbi:hypothetical protein LEP1GSC021_0748 [Leptospira noguchii str. 1993005606]|uniref:Uncharacterized protein n=1 Tax=Leptospira noguchii serovar Autumnalis str. ZUN142 TaxID=1085540 RepID=M6UFK0_9LEPT|nr:hypothetical protein LEP1GSC186_1971 [Leptospira noguchii serovar Autumnalis str. ZUN142]EPE82751.1 hypothetical protein LEP1GSC021_0748 [Leptospira noguchii str. 1993005606]TQE73369.1 hypothetical protein FF021_12550 [Leptospira noguchii]
MSEKRQIDKIKLKSFLKSTLTKLIIFHFRLDRFYFCNKEILTKIPYKTFQFGIVTKTAF